MKISYKTVSVSGAPKPKRVPRVSKSDPPAIPLEPPLPVVRVNINACILIVASIDSTTTLLLKERRALLWLILLHSHLPVESAQTHFDTLMEHSVSDGRRYVFGRLAAHWQPWMQQLTYFGTGLTKERCDSLESSQIRLPQKRPREQMTAAAAPRAAFAPVAAPPPPQPPAARSDGVTSAMSTQWIQWGVSIVSTIVPGAAVAPPRLGVRVKLADREVTDEQIEIVCESIRNNRTTRLQINLSDGKLSLSGLQALINALEVGRNWESLHISNKVKIIGASGELFLQLFRLPNKESVKEFSMEICCDHDTIMLLLAAADCSRIDKGMRLLNMQPINETDWTVEIKLLPDI